MTLPTIKTAADIAKWSAQNDKLVICDARNAALCFSWAVTTGDPQDVIAYGETAQSAIRKAEKVMRRKG